MKRVFLVLLSLLAVASMGFAQIEIVGAGATFPAPVYSKMFDEYAQMGLAKVNYQAIGSGGGIAQMKAKTVDFGASDAFLSDKDLAEMPAPIVHIPTVAGAVVMTYNLPGVGTLKFSPDIIADIFLGKIKNWSDPRLRIDNPVVNFPNENITVVHRSDGSGTTATFSDYLCKVSADWKSKVGQGTALSWPVGVGGKGNPGVAGLVKQLPGAIGYVELIYAAQNNMPVGQVKNSSGRFITPSLASVTEAAAVTLPKDMRVSITNTASPTGYPISGFTWILMYKEQAFDNRPIEKARAVVALLWWMIHDGQKFAKPLQYSPLSEKALKNAEAIVKSITYNGQPLMK
jgi:phosphate transport system substrate-binding protein